MDIIKCTNENIEDLANMRLDIYHNYHNEPSTKLQEILTEFELDHADDEIFYSSSDSKLNGYVAIKDNYVCYLYTNPEREKQGIGSTLLQFAEDYMKDSGHDSVTLNSYLSRIKFYENRGYEYREKKRMIKYL